MEHTVYFCQGYELIIVYCLNFSYRIFGVKKLLHWYFVQRIANNGKSNNILIIYSTDCRILLNFKIHWPFCKLHCNFVINFGGLFVFWVFGGMARVEWLALPDYQKNIKHQPPPSPPFLQAWNIQQQTFFSTCHTQNKCSGLNCHSLFMLWSLTFDSW